MITIEKHNDTSEIREMPEGELTESSKSPASIANIRLTK